MNCTSIDTDTAMADYSKTLLDRLALISPKYNGLPGCLIENMTYVVRNQCTSLLLAVGVLVREKNFVSLLSRFMITYNYDEPLRFRTYVAPDCVEKYENDQKVLDSLNGLIQVVIDKFDAEVSTQNNLSMVQKLAMIVFQSLKQNSRI